MIIKLSLAYGFWKMFFRGKDIKLVHMTYSFLELLIFCWLTLVDISCLEFISHHIKKLLYLNKYQTRLFTNLSSIVRFSKEVRQGVPYKAEHWLALSHEQNFSKNRF